MTRQEAAPSNWYGAVLTDLAQALRRDGLPRTAEILDDAALSLAAEEAELTAKRAQDGGDGLRLVPNDG